MPGKVKVKILAGRNLPIMDRGSLTTDAYVEIKLGNVCQKTEVARKTLNPQWNSDWYRFEVDDAELQDEPLQIRIMDYDTYSANDVIGKVYLNLNPLLLPTSTEGSAQKSSKGSVLSGWIPVYDTLQGIRGEINVILKVELFSDVNKFRQSSCGMQFFYSPCVPHGYNVQTIHGFVEELIVNDDPEYQWIDKIRTPRASNEARQVAFLKLSGQVQRKIGLKAVEMGANAVLGYKQSFDLENDIGVVARGIGTAVTIIRQQEGSQPLYAENILLEEKLRKAKESIGASSYQCSKSCIIKDYGASSSIINFPAEINAQENILLPSHAYSSGDITSLIERTSIKNLLEQEDNRLPVLKKPGYGWKLKSKNFFQKHLLMKSGRKLTSVPQSNTLFHSYGDLSAKTKIFDDSKKTDDSLMTRLLVRSVMATKFPLSELDNIAEHNDSPLIMRKLSSARIPAISIDSIPEAAINTHKNYETHISTASISTGSATSLTSEDYEDDDDDDENTTSGNTVQSEFETVSMVVKSVLEHEKEILKNSMSDSKLNETILKTISLGKTEIITDSKGHILLEPHIVKTTEPKMDIIEQILQTNDGKFDWIQPGSTTDEPEIETDEPKHDILHTLSEKIHHFQEHMHLSHFHHNDGKMVHHDHPGLLETAMATMLIDKLNIAEASAGIVPVEVQTSIDIEDVEDEPEESIFEEVKENLSEKLHRISSHLHIHQSHLENNESHTGNIREQSQNSSSQLIDKKHHKDSLFKEFIEKVHNVHLPTINTNEIKEKLHHFQDMVHLSHFREKSEEKHHHGLLETALETVLKEKAHYYDAKIKENPCDNSGKSIDRRYSLDAFKKRLALSKRFSIESSLFGRKKRSDSATSEDRDSVETLKNEPSNQSTESIQTINASECNSTYLESAPFVQQSQKIDYELLKTHDFNAESILQNSGEHKTSPRMATNPKLIDLNSNSSANKSINAQNTENYCDIPIYKIQLKNKANNNLPLDSTNQPSLHASSSFTNRNETLPSSPSKPSQPKTESTYETKLHLGSVGISINKDIPQLSTHHRRSSDSDLSITPKGNSLNSGDRINSTIQRTPIIRPTLIQDNLDMLEYPFLTINKFPVGFILHLGATVAARSVKLLERLPNPDEPETRDSWWNELRMEIRSHARAIGCNVVLGYSEVTTITDDVCVLSATGTACVVNFSCTTETLSSLDTSSSSKKEHVIPSSLEKHDGDELGSRHVSEKMSDSDVEGADKKDGVNSPSPAFTSAHLNCTICHIPYSQNSLPFKANMSKCGICKRHKVPDVLLSTIELPDGVQIMGRGCLIQAHVCRYKRDLKSEANAKEISDGLPFLEYELHRQLICKLKVKGMNAIFGLKATLSVGERMIALIATGTAVLLCALPQPIVPKIIAGNSWNDGVERLNDLQRRIQDTMERNKEIFQLKVYQDTDVNGKMPSDTDESDDELAELDLTFGNRDTCVLEVDDIQDLEVIALVMENNPPEGINVVNLEHVPGVQDLDVVKHLQMFAQVWRAKIPVNQPNSSFSKHFQRLLQTIYFKLRTMIPCVIAGLKFSLELPEADEMQILVTGMAYGLGEANRTNKFKKRLMAHSTSKDGVRRLDDDLIFNLEEDVDVNEQPPNLLHTGSLRLRKKSPTRAKNKIARHVSVRERYGVDITPLSYIPGGHIQKYLGNLNFFFIRESTCIRENGGISGFVHSFITEILAITRAHVSCLGGNAIVSFYMKELMLVDNPHKNQGQCLISVGGDVVFVSDNLEE